MNTEYINYFRNILIGFEYMRVISHTYHNFKTTHMLLILHRATVII